MTESATTIAPSPIKIEQAARDIRAQVRKKAGLEPMWNEASDSMKCWYRSLAIKMMAAATGTAQ